MKQNFVCKDFKTSSFTIGLNTTDYDVSAQTSLWTWVTNPIGFKLKTSQTINIKVNSSTWTNIQLTTSDNEFELYMDSISNFNITTTTASNIVFTLIWL
jgi:hypothetical protein